MGNELHVLLNKALTTVDTYATKHISFRYTDLSEFKLKTQLYPTDMMLHIIKKVIRSLVKGDIDTAKDLLINKLYTIVLLYIMPIINKDNIDSIADMHKYMHNETNINDVLIKLYYFENYIKTIPNTRIGLVMNCENVYELYINIVTMLNINNNNEFLIEWLKNKNTDIDLLDFELQFNLD